MVGKPRHCLFNRCENEDPFNYSHSNVFFLILVHVCFIFEKYVATIECLCKYSNHCCFFLNKENISYSDQGILYRKYWEEYYTLCEDVIVEKKVACANYNYST